MFPELQALRYMLLGLVAAGYAGNGGPGPAENGLSAA